MQVPSNVRKITLFVLCTGLSASGIVVAQEPEQDSGQGQEIEEVVVTGTRIRGAAAPVGSNLISVDREAIDKTAAQTTQQILKSIPALTGMGATPQGQNPSAYYMPTIHSLGSSSSNSTLVLIDGHRFSPGGQQQTLVDAGIVPPIAIERVEVLAEGASSIYGSDAVAGVVNFITRRSYDGVMVTGQTGFGDSYSTTSAGFLAGTSWDDGSAYIAYNYSDRSSLSSVDRDLVRRDQRSRGGSNFQSFSCAPATIQPGGGGPIFPSPTSAVPVANNSDNAMCDNTIYGDIFGDETRHNFMARLSQNITDDLSIGINGVFSNRAVVDQTDRGTLSATVFRTGSQANPFYVNPPGIDPGTAAGDTQTIRWSADELLGPGATEHSDAINYFVTGNVEYDLNDNFRLTALALYGREDSLEAEYGQLNESAALLALNGTTNGGGDLTRPSVPSTGQTVLNVPLTAANALDVWNPAATNRTSQSVLDDLIDTMEESRWFYSIKQARVGIDGSVFELPGGTVRVAVGGEYAYYGLDINRVRPNNTGPSSIGSEFFDLFLERDVTSAYAEILIPIVGAGNELPFVQAFDVSVSGRYDSYSDTGSTSNPRVAFTWSVVDGLRFRGNYAESFVAPQLTSYGDRSRGGLTSFSGYQATSGTIVLPIANFPLAAQLPGCTAPGLETCTITSATPGIHVNGGPADPKPGKGESWSIGVDIAPPELPGLRAAITLFDTKLINQITGTSVSNAINSTALNSNLQIFPNGATQADIDAVVGDFPQNSPLPPTSYYILSVRQQNVLNLHIQGIDATASYRMDTDSAGAFTVGASVSRFHTFDQDIAGGPTFSVLNTTGFNNTFPSIQLQMRLNLGWEYGDFAANLFADHIGSYRNWSGTTITPVEVQDGHPVSGGDKVDASTIFDLNLAYNFSGGTLEDTQLFADVSNVFDEDPPFYNDSNGVDRYSGNIIGRVITVGFRTAF